MDHNTRVVSLCEIADQCDWVGVGGGADNLLKADKALMLVKSFPIKRLNN